MEAYAIRTYGDPVLRSDTEEVADIDGAFHRTCQAMYESMNQVGGMGIAAPQVGIQKRFFVYDADLLNGMDKPSGTPEVIINPRIVEAEGEWTYEEGCLSVPGLSWIITRPKELLVKGVSLDGEEVTFEADELFARLILHEVDHLDGVLLVDHLDDDTRRAAKKLLREQLLGPS